MPFVFPHAFMPPPQRVGFAPIFKGQLVAMPNSRHAPKTCLHKDVPLTNPSPPKSEEWSQKNLKLLNWTTWMTKWMLWRAPILGTITGSSNWLPFGEKCTALSSHPLSKVMIVNPLLGWFYFSPYIHVAKNPPHMFTFLLRFRVYYYIH